MTTTTENTLPGVETVAFRRRDGRWRLVVVHCPYCDHSHSHMGTDAEMQNGDLGSRFSDCLDTHEPFREDCKPERHPARHQKPRCYVRHGGQYQLELSTVIDPLTETVL